MGKTILTFCVGVLIIGCIFYFGGFFTAKISPHYETILSGALARNTASQEKSEEVIFLRADYVDEYENQNTGNSMDHSLTSIKSSDFPIQHEIWKQYNTLEENTASPNAFSYNGISADILKGEKEFQNAGNFGTPNIPGRSSGGLSGGGSGAAGSSECKGIIFDPCIILEEPKFGGKENMFLGDTPIYKDPKAFG